MQIRNKDLKKKEIKQLVEKKCYKNYGYNFQDTRNTIEKNNMKSPFW